MAALYQAAATSLQLRLSSVTRSSPRPFNLSFSTRSPRGNSFKMFSNTVATTYASALAELAQSNNTLEATIADIEKVEEFISDPNLLRYLTNPTMKIEEKIEFLDEITKSYDLQPHVSNFLNILVEARRISEIEEIITEFERFYNTMTFTELAVVTSAVKLESDNLAQIAKQVQKLTGAKNVRIKNVIDPSLVAGFTIRYGGSGSKLLDFSVKTQLKEIASQLELGDIQLAQ